jgi:hypothetical protein
MRTMSAIVLYKTWAKWDMRKVNLPTLEEASVRLQDQTD